MTNRVDKDISWRDRIWNGFKIILALGLFWYAVSQTDLEQIVGVGRRISPAWLVFTFILFCVLTLLKTSQYNYITGGKAGYFKVLGMVIVQNALSNFVASTAGIASYLTMMGSEKDVRFARATLSFLIVKMADLVAVLILLAVSVAMTGPVPDSIGRVVLVICVIIVSILLVFFATIIFRKKFVGWVRKLTHVLRVEHWRPVDQMLGLLVSLSGQESSRIMRMMATSLGLSLIYMTVTLAWGYARLRTFAFDADFSVVALITCILQLASWVPVFVFGGLGISESISVYFFSAFGFDPPAVAAVLIAARVLLYLLNALTLVYIPLEGFFTEKKTSP